MDLHVHIRLLGQFEVLIEDVPAGLPQSIKARALLLYLILTGKPQRRDLLCNLLWEKTSDPKAGLRWALTKLRPVLKQALVTNHQTVSLDHTLYSSDITSLNQVLQGNATYLTLQRFEDCIYPEYLTGFDCQQSPVYQLWLESQRTEIRRLHIQIFKKILVSADGDAALSYARKWFAIDSYSIDSAKCLLQAQIREEGIVSAQMNLDNIRARWRESGFDENELLCVWRVITAEKLQQRNHLSITELDVIPDSQLSTVLVLPEKPSLAVLGFQSIVGEYAGVFAQGLTVDLTSSLSRLGGLFVSSLASSSRFARMDLTPREIGRLLGVAYLISGTTQSSDNQLRVTVNLIEANNESIVWSDSYTLGKEDIFHLQDEIVRAIVSRIEPEIEYAEYKRAQEKDPVNLNAWENYHLAIWNAFRFTAPNTEIAYNYLQRAIVLDEGFCRAHAALSFVHFSRAFLNSHNEPNKEIQRAKLTARRSIELDNKDAMGHWSLGRALFLEKEHDLAMASIATSLKANSNYAQGHYAHGFIGAHAGVADQTITGLDKAIRLSPFDPLLFAMKSSRALSLVSQGNYEEAARWGGLATQETNAHYHIYAIAAACFELSGDHEQAKKYIAQAKQKHPNYNQKIFFRSFPYKERCEKERFSSALSNAGLSEK